MATIDILEPLSLTEGITKCGFCRGYGEMSFGQSKEGTSEECPICNGKGKLLIRAEHFPLVECSRCEGTGSTYRIAKGENAEIEQLINHVCPSCQGAGCQALVGEWRIVDSYDRDQRRVSHTVHVTGISAADTAAAIETKTKLNHRCFVCRRESGEDSLIIDNEEPEIVTIELFRYHKQVDDLILEYLLCFDCAVLLGLVP